LEAYTILTFFLEINKENGREKKKNNLDSTCTNTNYRQELIK
jgi:hypothetical protein